LYNLLHVLEREGEIGNTRAIIEELQDKIKEVPVKTYVIHQGYEQEEMS